jgi:type IV pilus assembly protein PilA
MTADLSKSNAKGFTIIELLIVIAIMGTLASISVSNVLRYKKMAEFSAFKASMDVLMDAQDAYYLVNNKYYPDYGQIYVPQGAKKEIPEIGYTFPSGHKHRYYIYGINDNGGRFPYNYYYIMVYADEDYNNNGYNDILQFTTYIRNGKMYYNRIFSQIR